MLQKDWKYRTAIFTTLGMLGAITFTFTSIKASAQTPSPSPTPRATSDSQNRVSDQLIDQSEPALDSSVNTQNSRSRQNRRFGRYGRYGPYKASTSDTRRRVRNYTQRLPVICSTPIGKLIPWKCPNR